MRIRKVRAADLPRLVELYLEAYRGLEEYAEPTPEAAADYLRWLHESCPEGFWVAEVNGQPAGFIAADPDWRGRGREERALEIHEIVVAPDFRGRGIGRALMERALELGRRRGRREAALWVGEGNRTARDWYRKLGFEEVGRFGKWIRMRRPLPPGDDL